MVAQSNGSNLVVQGRLVWTLGSSVFEGKVKKDFNTNQPMFDVQGQQIIEYGFGLAIPKIDPRTGQNSEEFIKVWQALHQEAFTLYPSGQIPPSFAMKYKDGDGIDDKGQPFANREGYKGHIVLACTTQVPIKYFIFQGGNNILVNTGIKNGDYVNVQLNIKAHPAKGQGKAGLYLNPSAVQLIQPGKEIINTPSGDQIFGQTAPAYAGQVVADVAPQMPNMQAPAMPAPQAAPNYNVLPQNFQPAPAMPAPQGYPQAPNMPNMPNMQNTYAGQGVPPMMPPQAPQMQAPAMPGIPPMPR